MLRFDYAYAAMLLKATACALPCHQANEARNLEALLYDISMLRPFARVAYELIDSTDATSNIRVFSHKEDACIGIKRSKNFFFTYVQYAKNKLGDG